MPVTLRRELCAQAWLHGRRPTGRTAQAVPGALRCVARSYPDPNL